MIDPTMDITKDEMDLILGGLSDDVSRCWK